MRDGVIFKGGITTTYAAVKRIPVTMSQKLRTWDDNMANDRNIRGKTLKIATVKGFMFMLMFRLAKCNASFRTRKYEKKDATKKTE